MQIKKYFNLYIYTVYSITEKAIIANVMCFATLCADMVTLLIYENKKCEEILILGHFNTISIVLSSLQYVNMYACACVSMCACSFSSRTDWPFKGSVLKYSYCCFLRQET